MHQRVAHFIDHHLVELGLIAANLQVNFFTQFAAVFAHHAAKARKGIANLHHAQTEGGIANRFHQAAQFFGGVNQYIALGFTGQKMSVGAGDN